jgi:hypothetical protein
MRNKKRFSEYSGPGKAVLSVLIVISLVIIGTAERDIQGRDDDEVRGSRTLWRLVSLNAFGALAYMGWGRRRRPA